LKRHQADLHAEAVRSTSGERARAFQREMNRRAAGDWSRYARHRGHLTDLVLATATSGDVCVFGAGNASDVDLERLARHFQTIHLVDIDALALGRARERVTGTARDKLFLHELELTGFIDRIDEWSEQLPTDLAAITVEASRDLVSQLGRTFDVTVSNCVLSQLAGPFERMWARTVPEWSGLDAALTVGHLLTLAGALGAGGRGVLVFDTVSSARCPALSHLGEVPDEELEDKLAELGGIGDEAWTRNPGEILEAMEAVPLLLSLVEAPSLSQPWLWDLGDATQLVYGLVFSRRANNT
jgi:hypothetical protein